jgi:hypothetical protein
MEKRLDGSLKFDEEFDVESDVGFEEVEEGICRDV